MPSRRVSLPALVATLFGLLFGLLVTAPAADATSTIICKGFTACQAAGYSSYGYGPTNYQKMWWRMYAGHNCTNYMSYRMIQAGMSSTRPWSGSGDARNWGVVFSSKTDQTPMIGSVAWWSSNHVAYVQQIIDENTIIISEDHYRGDFDWRRITRAGGGWPTGFIHLVDEKVTPTVPPSVVGVPQVDALLSVKPGAWKQKGVTYKYQWLADGKAIARATTATYTPTPAQVGSAFTVKVVGSKPGFRAAASLSKTTSPTIPGVMTIDTVPVLDGIAKVTGVLTASVPTITPKPASISYGWFADGKYIPDSTGSTLTLEPAQLGKKISFVARATRPGYDDAVARSAATGEVLPELLSVVTEPRLIGTPHVGHVFKLGAGEVTPDATATYQWFHDAKVIKGATSADYTPTAADLGRKLSVKIFYSRPGYTTVVRSLKATQEVRTFAQIFAASKAKRSISVTVLADGVSPVTGKVVLTSPNGTQITATLKDGKAVFAPKWMISGKRTYTISYLGSDQVEARTNVPRSIDVK